MDQLTAERIIKDLKQNNPGHGHPRIIATKETWETIKKRIETDNHLNDWYRVLKKNTDRILTEELPKYVIPDGRRLLWTSRKVRARVEDLAMMYNLSTDTRYAERAWGELEAAASFPDWNPSHFLDTAEMTAAFAIGYDWLYSFLTVEQKKHISRAIVEKGLHPGLEVYHGSQEYLPAFATMSNNWNVVCNGGIAMGALAVGDEFEDVSGEVLSAGLKSLEIMLPEFAPDGGWPEGVMYWHYTIRFLVNYIASLDTALGTNYGYFRFPGIEETAYFSLYLTGTEGVFNFHDCAVGKINAPEYFWFADKLNAPDLSGIRLKQIQDNISRSVMRDLLWYNPDNCNKEINLPLDAYYRKTEAVTFRNCWNDSEAIFLGLHGGYNNISHGNLDIGTFVLDALGERWAIDLGGDDYNLPGYWDERRWTYYRMTAEGHNTLVINPDFCPDQDPEAIGKIIKYKHNADSGLAIVDMTSAYPDIASDIKRGVKLFDNRRKILIQDEIRLKEAGDVFWFMHTDAEIEKDSARSVILRKNGKKLGVRILTPVSARFTIMEALPLSSSPDGIGQQGNPGVQKLTICIKKVETAQITVLLVPLSEEAPKMNDTILKPLNKW